MKSPFVCRPARRTAAASAFTLVELLVVIGIIAILISILLPVMGKVRARSTTVKCQSNLRQVSMAALMYANAYKGVLPYPTTTHGESMLWFNAVDPFLASKNTRGSATGVAVGRTYKNYKQCPVYEWFEGDKTSGGQGNSKEYARTFKYNNHLRRVNFPNSGVVVNPAGTTTTWNDKFTNARLSDIREAARFVFIGDGLSLDITGPVESQTQSGEFSMEVTKNVKATIEEAPPALRHQNGANIAFLDGHVETINLPIVEKQLATPKMMVKTWESEFVNTSGAPASPNGTKSMESQSITRNPRSALIWSVPGKLFARNS